MPREIAGETILVPVSGKLASLQRVFALNPVAAFVWDRIDGRRDDETILRDVIAQFDVAPEAARADLKELIETLLAAHLIEPAEVGG